MDQLDKSARQISLTDQLFGQARPTSSLFSKLWPVRIDPSVCTLSQLPSPTKALFIIEYFLSGVVSDLQLIVFYNPPLAITTWSL